VSATTVPARPGKRRSRYGLLATLYVSQYVGVGFLTVGLVSILREGGTSLQTLGLVQLLGLIWPLKFLWAPLIDSRGSRRRGHYRSWVLLLQAGMVASLLALLPFAPPADGAAPVGGLLAVCAVYVMFSATQDVAADAIAVRLLGPHEHGTGNGIQVAGSYAGTVLGGGACVLVYDVAGWSAAVLLLAALTGAALAVVLRFREPDRLTPPPPTRAAFGALWSVFREPGCRWWALVVVPLLYCAAAGAYALVTPALVDAGWSLARIGVVTGVVTSVPALVAALAGGVLTSRWGAARVLTLGCMALVTSIAALVPLLVGRAPLVGTTLALCAFLAAYTVVNVVVYTVNMRLARPDTAGTDVTVLTSSALVSSFLASAIALGTASWIGYPATAAGAALLAVAGAVVGHRHLARDRRPGTAPATPQDKRVA
jgi:predicted MFS family arabinose efflux permease